MRLTTTILKLHSFRLSQHHVYDYCYHCAVVLLYVCWNDVMKGQFSTVVFTLCCSINAWPSTYVAEVTNHCSHMFFFRNYCMMMLSSGHSVVVCILVLPCHVPFSWHHLARMFAAVSSCRLLAPLPGPQVSEGCIVSLRAIFRVRGYGMSWGTAAYGQGHD